MVKMMSFPGSDGMAKINFPTHGDSKPVIDIIHNGSDDVDGLSVGLDKDKEILVIKGEEGEDDVEIKGQAEINKKLRERLAAYDFEGTLNSPISKTLYSRSLKKNLEKLDKIKGKDVKDLTSTEERLLKTWYGDNWEKNFQGEFEKGDEKDMIAVYEKDGTAGFGPWIGSDPNLGKTNPTANFQRGVVSNGLIMDYEDEYLYEEKEAKVINDQDAEEADLALMGVDDATAMAIETDEDKVNVQAKFDSLKPGETMTMKTANGEVETIKKPKFEVEEEVKLDINDKAIVEEKEEKAPRVDSEGNPREELSEEEIAKFQEKKDAEKKDEVVSFTSKTVGDDKKVKAYTAGEEITMSFVDASGNTVNKKITPRSNRLVSMTKQDDGADGIRRILNFEGVMGSSSGTGLSNYGFSSSANAKDSKGNPTKGAKLRKAYDAEVKKLMKGSAQFAKMDEKEAKGQAAINVFLGVVMPQAAKEMHMLPDEFSSLDNKVQHILGDWEFNTGRDVGQLATHAYITGNKELAKKHPNITEAINGKGSVEKVWEVGGKKESAEQYLDRIMTKDTDYVDKMKTLTSEMILNSKHAIMGDEKTRTKDQIKAYKAGHQYRINLFK